MADETITGFLEQLAARTAAPGGGGVAALQAAQAAALVAMVARYSDGPRSAGHAELVASVLAEADGLRATCEALITADAEAFASVAGAYKLPRDTPDQTSVRQAAIAAALIPATHPQAEIVARCGRLLGLAEALRPVANRSVIGDLAAAVAAIGAAVTTARINIEANVAGITDAAARSRYLEVAAGAGDVLRRADALTAGVRAELTRSLRADG
ncbi:MAG TPA: cyclodeaminase/cyclohydrolase family protein [Streptosporangiaceae bacterium]|nr:cyclodeaminase/cyclohydrolase family protein [Streptosporangiaceae bacterium]